MHHYHAMIAIAAALSLAPVDRAQAGGRAGTATAAPVVRIESGMLQGESANGLNIFRGIPYAAPPVGELRWRPPIAAAPWADIRPALKFGNDCEQTRRTWDTGRPDAKMSEDCLTLNVWAPVKRPAKGAPVMFWIHGGSFTAGSSAQLAYDGARLAARGVVVVTINYRLGRFGFFAHPALTREAEGKPVGNFGIMDQIAALRWVQRNISAFGGNPKSVTIFGESAGGGSVNLLMTSPEARGLFHRAISQSGGGRDRGKSLAEAEAVGKAFATGAGVATDDPAALRALPAEAVRGGARLESETAIYSGPFIDGMIVPEDVDAAFEAGRQAAIPYLAGATSDEIAILPQPLRAPATAIFVAQMGGDLAPLKAAYGSQAAFDAHVMSDAIFGEPARHLARASAANRSYLYNFDYVAEAERGELKGAPHSYEVPFVFGTLGLLKSPPSASDTATAELLADYWTSFAKTGRPTAPGHAAWPAYSPGKPAMMVFTASGPVVRDAASQAFDALAAHAEQKKASRRPAP